MNTIINTGTKNNPSYIYCNVDCQVSNYDTFATSQEAFDSIKKEIILECKTRNYNSIDTERILNHYYTLFSNSNIW